MGRFIYFANYYFYQVKITHLLEHYPKSVFWITCFLLCVLQYFFGLHSFYFDAERYWESGRELDVDGTFSLYNYVTKRGVLFPLINYILITGIGYFNGNEIAVFKCINTLFVCWGVWRVVPALYTNATGNVFKVWQKLLLTGVVHFFWFRYISCPLSDFLCLFLLLQGFNLLWTEKLTFQRIVLVGFICGFVFNTRPIYNLLLAVYPIFLLVVSKQGMDRKMMYVLSIILASILINIPQVLVNQKIWKAHTFFQPTHEFYEGNSLYLGQLRWGLYLQKYETYVGDPGFYKRVQVLYYQNKEGIKAEEDAANQLYSYEDYFLFLKQHPSTLLRFFKNGFNGTDIKYNTPYIYDLRPSILFSLLNYCIWFLGLVALLIKVDYRKSAAPVYWIIGYLGLTCVLCFPIAMEPRFLLSLYLLMYVLVVVHTPTLIVQWSGLPAVRKVSVLMLMVVFVCGCFMLSQQTDSQLEFPLPG